MHEQISVVPIELSDKIFDNLCQITGKAKKDKGSAKSFIQKKDHYKEKWLAEFLAIFEKMMGACHEVQIYNVIAAWSEKMVKDLHKLVQEITHPEFDTIKTKLGRRKENNYKPQFWIR